MNLSSSEINGLKLPAPVPEQMPTSGAGPETGNQFALEAPASAAERSPAGTQPTIPVLPSVPLPPLGQAPQSSSPATTLPKTAILPDGADDADLIEKEWVNKAKQIVEKTRNDPYEQSKEITLFKADYMKKRYNKTLKLSE